MRAVGGLLLVVGLVLAIIAGAWGRSGFYVEQAPILLVLAIGALICVGAGAAMLRYHKPGFASGSSAQSTAVERALGRSAAGLTASATPAPAPSPVVAPPTAASISIAVPGPAQIADPIDEKTRDRVLNAGDWTVALPDGTVLPIADGLVIGRQPVSSDGGPTAAVPSTEVSKSHARFRVLGDGLAVRDLDTTNGTVVVHPDDTEERVSSIAETPIGSGDRLEIGSYVLEVQRRP